MDYLKNNRCNIIGGFVIAINILVLFTGLTSKSIGTFLGESVEISVGSSIDIGISETKDISKFSFTNNGKVSKKILKYQPNPMDTFINNAQIIDVPFIDQRMLYPTGCESVSTTTVLQYYGIDITVDDFIENHLVKADLKIVGYKRGKTIFSSEHPNRAFIGNPKSANGLG